MNTSSFENSLGGIYIYFGSKKAVTKLNRQRLGNLLEECIVWTGRSD